MAISTYVLYGIEQGLLEKIRVTEDRLGKGKIRIPWRVTKGGRVLWRHGMREY